MEGLNLKFINNYKENLYKEYKDINAINAIDKCY